jgi:endonuclease/exonuclease/phosphatase family metal-dependent hydrolase
VLANWPVAEARVIYFKQQSMHWQPRWFMPDWAVFQRRLGGRLALVVNFGRMVVYNVHLESRASEEMRRSQIEEVIADARRYPATTPIIVAGDMNTRVANPPVAAALVAAGFRQALGGEITTTHKTALDWIFIRGGVSHSDGRIHRDVRASDHFPLSLRLDFSPCR